MKKLTILSFSAFLLFIACRKDKDVQNVVNNTSGTSTAKVIADSAVIIINPTDKQITFIWYDTLGTAGSGYKYNDSIVVPPNDTVNIPTSRFASRFGCFYWYHSADMSVNNWYEINNYPYHRTDFSGTTGSKIAITINGATSVYITKLLSGSWSKIKNEWYAIDAYNASGTSVWGAMSVNDRNQKLNIYYSSGFQYVGYYTGAIDSAGFSYPALAAPPSFSVEMKGNEYTSSKIASFKLTDALPTTTPISTTAQDTMFMTINGAPPHYKLYRKP